jgi:hypothetical protein
LKKKIIHIPTSVGGNSSQLSIYLKNFNYNSECWIFSQNYLNYKSDKIITKKKDSWLLKELKRIFALRYIFFCDIVFFNFGRSLFAPIYNNPKLEKSILISTYNIYACIMQRIELSLLKIFGKKIFIQYQGDDARQGDYLLKNYEISIGNIQNQNYYSLITDNIKKKQIKLFEKYCNKIYALNPDLLGVLPSSAIFLPYGHIALEEWEFINFNVNKSKLHFAHAPSHRGVKGTELVLNAIDNLKMSKYDFDFTLIEGLSNIEAKEVYKNVDIIIDQLYAGWYGGLAVEAMALGKIVLVYIREEDLQFIPEQMKNDLPFIRTSPSTIEADIVNVLKMSKSDINKISINGRKYVEKWHNPNIVAKKISHDIEYAFLQK